MFEQANSNKVQYKIIIYKFFSFVLSFLTIDIFLYIYSLLYSLEQNISK